MQNSIFERFDARSDATHLRLVLLSPFLVIPLGQLAARTLGPALGVWSWLPLTTGYWVILTLIIIWGGGQRAINKWLQPSRRSWLWPLLAISIAVLPTLPMQFPNTWRFLLQTRIWLPTLVFVVINPLAEEGYWRGLLLDAMTNANKWLAVLFSSILFTINHMWISVMVIGARNPMASIFQFVFGVLMSLTYLKTQSLRWPLVAHFLANLFTPTVAVFLNLYVPASP